MNKNARQKVGSSRSLDWIFFAVTFLAVMLVFTKTITPDVAWSRIIGNNHLSPIGILILFFAMVFMSVYLDSCGFFEYCARLAVSLAGDDGRRLFFSLYATVSILTIFTSNDIIILTFTPFVYYFAKHSGIDPKPYLIAEFFAANTWSMMLYVGNPTNILIASAFGIKFGEYFSIMLFPTLAAGIANLLVIYHIFKEKINSKIKKTTLLPSDAITDRLGASIGMLILGLCIIGLSIAPYFGWQMWLVSFYFATSLAFFILLRFMHGLISGRHETIGLLSNIFKKMPWQILPFLLSLFIIIEVLNSHGISELVGIWLNAIAGTSIAGNILAYGISSALMTNIVNNIPMTVLFSSILPTVPQSNLMPAAYATIIGSNLGAILTPIGALAGIMWLGILKNYGMPITFREFTKYGLIVGTVTLAASLFVLILEFAFLI